MHFELNARAYPKERYKVLFAVACIAGAPRNRLRNIQESGDTPAWMSTWPLFKQELRRQYGDPTPEHTAAVRLFQRTPLGGFVLDALTVPGACWAKTVHFKKYSVWNFQGRRSDSKMADNLIQN
jgi:hypothetical protein